MSTRREKTEWRKEHRRDWRECSGKHYIRIIVWLMKHGAVVTSVRMPGSPIKKMLVTTLD